VLRLRVSAFAFVGGTLGAVAVPFVGCGDDSSGNPMHEAGADQTAEGAPDATPDVALEAGEAGRDVLAVDMGPDHDASEGSTLTDSSSSCTSDASSDGPNAVLQFAAQYAQAYCSGQGKCCPGYDAGAFDLASCAASWTTLGWESTLPSNAAVYTRCHLAFDPTRGSACISALQNFDCAPDGGPVTATQYNAVTTACQGILVGTLANGAPGCLSSFECVNGYCKLPSDGGTGTCTALVGDGGACVSGDTPDEMCSQAGSYQPALWCNRLDGGTTGTCAPPLADGVTCYVPAVSATYFDDYGCINLLCGDDGLCGHPATYPPIAFCGTYLPTDAGGGG
jgi:hypothetical protein